MTVHGPNIPFTARATHQDGDFWAKYNYHRTHGNSTTDITHDVRTGPGNIAVRLLRYYNQVVGSDINEEALAAGAKLVPADLRRRLTFIHSPAEELADDGVVDPAVGGGGLADLVLVSECMPLLDAPRALAAFGRLLRPGGTLAIFFYGRPIFAGVGTPDDTTRLNALYENVATRICSVFGQFAGTPAFPIRRRAVETFASRLNNVAVPGDEWEHVVRYQWNSDVQLFFNSKAVYDFDVDPVDRRQDVEVTKEITDRTWWQDKWDTDRIEAFLASVYPGYVERAGSKFAEINQILQQIRQLLEEEKATLSFSAVLILATKK